MMDFSRFESSFPQFYLLGSRFLTHAIFWLGYYIAFGFIWMEPEQGYFASFYLEFVLMPVRILAAYCMIYFLIPNYLVARQYQQFFIGYAVLLLIAGVLQLVFSHFFYHRLLLNATEIDLGVSALARNMVLINTTVLLLGTVKVFQLYIQLMEAVSRNQSDTPRPDFLEVKSDRRIHRLPISQILFIEGMGNYVTYYLDNGDKKIVYSSIKETLQNLPEEFLRLHRSYIVNRTKIQSYNKDNVLVGDHELPRGKDIDDEHLQALVS
jgi:two-component system, LytTR family, response regulator LytT